MVQKKLPTINSAHGSETRNIINELIKLFNGMGYTYDEALQRAHSVLSEAKKTNNMNKDVQQQINNLILSDGKSDAEVIQARGNEVILKDRLDKTDNRISDVAINPKDYGLSENATWQVNRDALQTANDLAYSNGGGKVLIPPGTFNVKGVWQDSNVEFIGNGSTIKHPDGVGADIIRSRVHETTGTIGVAANLVTVLNPAGIEEGSVIAIRAAGGIHPSQHTTITSGITSTQTTGIVLANRTGFLNNGFLQIGSEVIQYTGISGNTLTGVTRGVFGTAKAAHSSGKKIGLALRHYAEVKSISGNMVTLKENVSIEVANAEVSTGIINPKITNIKFDGNRLNGGAPSEVHPLKWELTRFGKVDDVTVKDGEAGFMMRNGNRDMDIDRPIFIDCSVTEKSFGSGGWLFRANQRCTYRNVTAIGDMWTGIYFDDRTTIGSEWDGENIDCVADGLNIKLDRLAINLGIAVVGSIRSVVRNAKISGPRTAFSCTSNSQGVGYPEFNSIDCKFENIEIDNVYQPAIIEARRTKVKNVTYDEDTVANRTFVDNSPDTSYESSGGYNPRTTMDDGTYNAPAISFTNDRNTGIYRIADGQIQFVSKGTLILRITNTGIMFAEGKDMSFGGGTGTRLGMSPNQKLSFFGATPITQPPLIGTIAASASQEEVINQMNQVIIALRNLGLVGNS